MERIEEAGNREEKKEQGAPDEPCPKSRRAGLANPFASLSPLEWTILIVSIVGVITSYLLAPSGSVLNLIASLVGVISLIFVSKGMVFGQILMCIFAILYGIVSLRFAYYGEMITYMGMTLPMAALSVFEWLRHPYGEGKEVAVGRLTVPRVALMLAITAAVTVAFYFILAALGTARLLVSTVSVATSFLAAYLTFLRSPLYALAYAANDAVLIVLWIFAGLADPSSLPMIICFLMFFINDMYGFFYWLRMQKRQQGGGEA